jgi:hypothetical protein
LPYDETQCFQDLRYQQIFRITDLDADKFKNKDYLGALESAFLSRTSGESAVLQEVLASSAKDVSEGEHQEQITISLPENQAVPEGGEANAADQESAGGSGAVLKLGFVALAILGVLGGAVVIRRSRSRQCAVKR